MKRSKFSEEQVPYALRQAESGTPVGDICRQLGVTEATFYTALPGAFKPPWSRGSSCSPSGA